ncbi:YopX family protein [Bacillus velezensis]|uniref:YopX family protein n=1 Tax=Bacillus velezensis TaxID=492670 RepID=UPI000C9EED21|nr:YopX family protein [Bacillus velezensis]AUS15134.1 hypothetical protein C0W57_02585 [Bacillus velezensis]MED1774039.1 YopX family protein [Bacillus velezensis]PJN84877.1 hypothetical protein CV739_09040 [Bacillus velezensis]RXK26685.1 hypothetical protein P42_16260 [Bacillus velezensis]URD63153.1 YopX family protein [Bacillus velezensis]
MREIKFRAWNKENLIMVYEDEDDSSAYWDGICLSEIEMVNARLKYNNIYIWMQYTGLKDKNGREIYEGDIREDRRGDIFTVVYENDFASFVAKYNNRRRVPLDIWGVDSEFLGTVYEKPELLEASHASK